MLIFKPKQITNNIDMLYKLALFFFIDFKQHKIKKREKGGFYEVFVTCQEKNWAICLQILNYLLHRSF
jgi:hypothetical protein